ncbi:molecular chaperone [Clostridiaceae bacterium]|nr:molecular chaperone [Clostridiaceae bacterium]
MDKYGYTIKPKKEEKPAELYRKPDLALMTTFQLREICRREKIIQGVMDPMDREDLIRVILRYRGADEYFLIRRHDEAGLAAAGRVFKESVLRERRDLPLTCSSRIVAYKGCAIRFYDGLTLPWEADLAGTNAFIVSGDMTVCAILNLLPLGGRRDCLYLTMEAESVCRESEVKNYSLYCMGRRESEKMYRICSGTYDFTPGCMEVYRIPLLDFEVREPVRLPIPAAMDFGTSSTTAGVWLDRQYFEKAGLRDGERGLHMNQANYALFYDTASDWKETPLLPSAVGVCGVGGGVCSTGESAPEFLFGYDAVRLAGVSSTDGGFCVFYDIKRWVSDYEKQEEITDRSGRGRLMRRADILKAYFEYVIQAVRDRFKCRVEAVHISCPVRQKARFQALFAEILPEYAAGQKDMIDEGVSVLYNTISELLENGRLQDGEEYQALIIDCGGGTTDLCSCRFRVWDRRAAYRIEIDTAYENGDTDFGGNNITWRVMQLIKVALVNRLYPAELKSVSALLSGFDCDVFRYVDENGCAALYRELESEYQKAEKRLPTRFREFENQGRADYYKVKNNFYVLFGLAEKVKKEFYGHVGTLRIALSSGSAGESADARIQADKWKLSVQSGRGLETIKEFPEVLISVYGLELLLKADIYGVIRRFMEPMYEENALEDYSIIKLTGQSCRIGMFRDALKEFVPGKLIRFRRQEGQGGDPAKDAGLKMACIQGALRYLRDRQYGFADLSIRAEEPALPYQVTAYTHTGEEAVLIRSLERNARSGIISRNLEDLTLKLYLKDPEGRERRQYACQSSLSDFEEKTYEEIRALHGDHICQADTDDIAGQEARFFVWAKPGEWAFCVVPVYRKDGKLYLGKEETCYFENEGWMQNFFDGMK